MDDLPDYQYIRLPTADHIRLLELFPCGSDANKPIQCRLVPSLLAEVKDTYAAISYAWGDSARALWKPVVCDDFRALITPNLHSALVKLRGVSSSRLLWVDALCIDQCRDEEGLEERAQQVQLMNKIFASARSVVIDLGEVEAADKILLECFDELERISQDDWVAATAKFNYPLILNPDGSGTSNAGVFLPWMRSAVFAGKSFVSNAVFGTSNPPRWESLFDEPNLWTALKRFLERPWFGRLWVIQEFALAKEVYVLVGQSVKSENFLSNTLSRLRTHFLYMVSTAAGQKILRVVPKVDLASHIFLRHGNSLHQLLEIRHSFRGNKVPYSSFPEVFTKGHLTSCSDVRDKVYGLLGLIHHINATEIFINYKEKEEDLAFRITTLFLHQGKGVYALYNSLGCGAAGVSWALSLHYRGETDQLALTVPLESMPGYTPYQACGHTQPVFICNELTKNLSSQGCILDTLSDVTGALIDSVGPEGTRHARLQWQLEAYAWVARHTIRKSFSLPKISGRRTTYNAQEGAIVRQLARNHDKATKDAVEAFELACWTTAIAGTMFHGGSVPRRVTSDWRLKHYIQAFKAYIQQYLIEPAELLATTTESSRERVLQQAGPYLGSLQMAYNRRLGITSERLVCLIPEASQIGDRVAIREYPISPLPPEKHLQPLRLFSPCYIRPTFIAAPVSNSFHIPPSLIK